MYTVQKHLSMQTRLSCLLFAFRNFEKQFISCGAMYEEGSDAPLVMPQTFPCFYCRL